MNYIGRLFRFKDNTDSTFRFLYLDDNKIFFYYIDINDSSFPCKEKYCKFIENINENNIEIIEETVIKRKSNIDLPQKHIQIRDLRWDSIKDLIYLQPNIYEKRYRGKLVNDNAIKKNVSLKFIYANLKLYWKRGLTIDSLLPNYSECGGHGKAKTYSGKKLGRPASNGLKDSTYLFIDDTIKSLFESHVLDFLNVDKKFNLTTIYNNIIKSEFKNKEHIPSFRQFQYWFSCYKEKYNFYIDNGFLFQSHINEENISTLKESSNIPADNKQSNSSLFVENKFSYPKEKTNLEFIDLTGNVFDDLFLDSYLIVGKVLKFECKLYRILWVSRTEKYFYCIDVEDENSLPISFDFAYLNKCLSEASLYSLETDTFLTNVIESELTDAEKKCIYNRWSKINDVVSCEPDIYMSSTRGEILKDNMVKKGVPPKHMYSLLKLYWKKGLNKYALLPKYNLSGGKGKHRISKSKKLGRPSKNSKKYEFELDKTKFILKQISRTDRKTYENYVVNRIWTKLDNLDLIFITQKHIKVNGNLFYTDMYFPQVGLHIEIDESAHKSFKEKDIKRDELIFKYANETVLRVDVDCDINEIHKQINYIVDFINDRIRSLGDSFIPWTKDNKNNFINYLT